MKMNNFEIQETEYVNSYVDIIGSTYSMLVAIDESYDEDNEGNGIQATVNNEKLFASLNKAVQEHFKEHLLLEASVSFPAVYYNDEDEKVSYDATMKLTDFDHYARFTDNGYFGGLELEWSIFAPEDNEDFDNEVSMEPVVLLAAWKLEELLNSDPEFWNQITSQAYEECVEFVTVEAEAA